MYIIIIILIAVFLLFAAYAFWPESEERRVERAVEEELSRREFKARVDAEVARRTTDTRGH